MIANDHLSLFFAHPYHSGGTFELEIAVPKNYPLRPPKIHFVTKVFHPNIHFKTGEICLDLLKNAWSGWCDIPPPPKSTARALQSVADSDVNVVSFSSLCTAVYTLQSVCRSIIALLAHPEPDSPLNCDCGKAPPPQILPATFAVISCCLLLHLCVPTYSSSFSLLSFIFQSFIPFNHQAIFWGVVTCEATTRLLECTRGFTPQRLLLDSPSIKSWLANLRLLLLLALCRLFSFSLSLSLSLFCIKHVSSYLVGHPGK